MDLQTMGGKPVTSDNALSHNNLRAHSPQTAGDSRPQPDTPIGLEESWRNANSCARCRSPGCAVPYEDPATGRPNAALLGGHMCRRPFLLRNIGRLAMASRGSRIRVKTPGGDNGVKWPPSLRLRPGPTT